MGSVAELPGVRSPSHWEHLQKEQVAEVRAWLLKWEFVMWDNVLRTMELRILSFGNRSTNSKTDKTEVSSVWMNCNTKFLPFDLLEGKYRNKVLHRNIYITSAVNSFHREKSSFNIPTVQIWDSNSNIPTKRKYAPWKVSWFKAEPRREQNEFGASYCAKNQRQFSEFSDDQNMPKEEIACLKRFPLAKPGIVGASK